MKLNWKLVQGLSIYLEPYSQIPDFSVIVVLSIAVTFADLCECRL